MQFNAVQATELQQLDDVDPAFARLALGHIGRIRPQLFRNVQLRQARLLAGTAECAQELPIFFRVLRFFHRWLPLVTCRSLPTLNTISQHGKFPRWEICVANVPVGQLRIGHELRERYAQGRRQLLDVQEGNVPLAPLDAADVRAVQAGQGGKLLLGDALPQAHLAEPDAEAFEDVRQGGSLFQLRKEKTLSPCSTAAYNRSTLFTFR